MLAAAIGVGKDRVEDTQLLLQVVARLRQFTLDQILRL